MYNVPIGGSIASRWDPSSSPGLDIGLQLRGSVSGGESDGIAIIALVFLCVFFASAEMAIAPTAARDQPSRFWHRTEEEEEEEEDTKS